MLHVPSCTEEKHEVIGQRGRPKTQAAPPVAARRGAAAATPPLLLPPSLHTPTLRWAMWARQEVACRAMQAGDAGADSADSAAGTAAGRGPSRRASDDDASRTSGCVRGVAGVQVVGRKRSVSTDDGGDGSRRRLHRCGGKCRRRCRIACHLSWGMLRAVRPPSPTRPLLWEPAPEKRLPGVRPRVVYGATSPVRGPTTPNVSMTTLARAC